MGEREHEREGRLKVAIIRGVRGVNAGEVLGEEVEYLFFGTREAVLERFEVYLGAVLGLDEEYVGSFHFLPFCGFW